MKTLRILLAALGMALPAAANAQTERPQPLQELFFNEVVYPQDKGEVQVTLGTLIDRTEAEKAALFPLSFELGLTNSWQVGASIAGYSLFHDSPFANLRSSRIAIGTKYSFMNIGHSPFHAAAGVELEFPGELEKEEGDTEMEVEPYLALAVDAGSHVTLFGTLGTSFNPRTNAADVIDEALDDPSPLSFGGLVAFHYLTVAIEYSRDTTSLPWRLDGAPVIAPSVMIHPGHKWELGFGFPVGLRNASHTPGFAMNIIKEFGGE